MGDTSRVIRKFERMMMKIHEESIQGKTPQSISNSSQENKEIIGYFTYDFNKGTETYTKIS